MSAEIETVSSATTVRSGAPRAACHLPGGATGRIVRRLACPVVGLLAAACASALVAADTSPPATLTVVGGSLVGRLLDSPAPDAAGRSTIRWQATEFVEPLEFPADAVARIFFPPPAVPGDAPAPWRLELADGDALVGNLLAIDGQVVWMAIGDGAKRSTVAVDRTKVKRIVRHDTWTEFDWDGSLDAWTLSSAEHWRRSPRGIANRRPWAALDRPLGDARRFRIDLRLAWSEPPQVRIGVDVGAEAPPPSNPAPGVMIAGNAVVAGAFQLRVARAPGVMFGGNGDSEAAEPRPMPYRIEIAGDEVIAIRDECDDSGKGRADLRICGNAAEGGIGLSLAIDLDAGRMVVTDPEGRTIQADLTLPPGGKGMAPRLRIEFGGDEVELRSLRVAPWKGEALTSDVAAGKGLLLRDGEAIAGSGVTLEEGAAAVAVRTSADGPGRDVPLDSVREIPFAAAAYDPGARAEAAQGSVRVTDRFGSRLIGTLSRVEGGKALIVHPAIDGAVGISLESLVAIESVGSPAPAPPLPGPKGRFVAEGADIEGCLVRVEGPGPATIGWLPLGSLTAAAPCAAEGGGPRPATIRYRPPAADPSETASVGKIGVLLDHSDGEVRITAAIPGGPIEEIGLVLPVRILAIAPRGDGRFVEVDGLSADLIAPLLQGPEGSPVEVRIKESAESDPRTLTIERRRLAVNGAALSLEQILAVHEQLLHGQAPPDPAAAPSMAVVVLVSGESIGCRVDAIDDRGLEVRRPDGEAVTIPHENVQAVELVPSARMTLSPEKFKSLVTLPRSQRGQPPTHLVRSPAGDYLRGRLLALDADSLRIAVDSDPRGKPTTIPRSDVARIVWLHPEVLADDWVPPRSPAVEGLEVEAVGLAGERTRIIADTVEGSVLSGRHAVLGPWRVDLDSVERLRIGNAFDASPLAAPYSKWQLRPAPEPRNLPPRKKAANGN